MKRPNELHLMVYDYLATRILFGYYQYGESLPAISKICSYFRLAAPTVRVALSHLEKDRYIEIVAPKSAKVIYKATPDEIRQNFAVYLTARKDGILDIGQAGLLLTEPCWEAAMKGWNEADWDDFRRKILLSDSDLMPLPAEIYMYVLSTLKNKLILNFYWDILRYLRFPYLTKRRNMPQAFLNDAEKMTNEELIAQINRESVEYYSQISRELPQFIKESLASYPVEQIKQVPFEWNIYRRRPQLRYSLAALMIREIMHGRYPVGGYLPPLPKLSQQYKVSETTARRAIKVLIALGAVRSFQGKGTQVCLGQAAVDFSGVTPREALTVYQDSLQFLALTIRSVGLFTLQSVDESVLDTLTQTFASLRENQKGLLIFETILSFVTDHCPCSVVRNCYERLKGCLAVGYPIQLPLLGKDSLDAEYIRAIAQAERDLKTQDLQRIANGWSEIVKQQQAWFRPYAEKIIEDSSEDSAADHFSS